MLRSNGDHVGIYQILANSSWVYVVVGPAGLLLACKHLNTRKMQENSVKTSSTNWGILPAMIIWPPANPHLILFILISFVLDFVSGFCSTFLKNLHKIILLIIEGRDTGSGLSGEYMLHLD